MAMIPSKEAKEMLYSLLAENFVSLQVTSSTLSFFPCSLSLLVKHSMYGESDPIITPVCTHVQQG